jgi:endonuclease/exonuclease/phosphatase (EEP) superfamily protein YafD
MPAESASPARREERGRDGTRRQRGLPATWRAAVDRLTTAAAALTLLVALLVQFTGDRTGTGMLLLFAPRHWLPIPWLLLLPVAWATSRRTFAVAVAGLLLALFPLAMFELPMPWRPRAASTVLRLVSWNTDRSRPAAWRLREYLAEWNADVVVLQDCKTETSDSVAALRGVTVHTTPEFCVISRLPADAMEEMPPRDGGNPALGGRFGRALRFRVRAGDRAVWIHALHLESPRDALWAALHGNIGALADNVQWRALDSRGIAGWVATVAASPRDGVIVAGDFNLPAGSAILRRDWGGYRNAFSDAGFGFGHTMFAGKHAVRIDHVLLSPALVARTARVDRGYPAEHQPLIVEVGWRQ